MDAACTIQDSIHVFSLVHKYVSRILGTYQFTYCGEFLSFFFFIDNFLQYTPDRYNASISC